MSVLFKFETLVQILQLLSVGRCVWEIQNYDARIFHPFFFLLHTCTQIERDMEGETANFWGRCSTSWERRTPKQHFSRRAWRNLTPWPQYTMRCGLGRGSWSSFQAFGGCVAALVVSRRKHPPPKVNKARYSRSKMRESHCKSAAHDATQKRTEILVYCARFSGLRSGSAGNNPLSRRSTRILP